MKPHHAKFFMDTACRAGEMSYAQRLKVGALLVREGNILAIGVNGTSPGDDNVCEEVKTWYEDGELKTGTFTKTNVRHAEDNLLIKLARSAESAVGATAFVSHLPCPKCARTLRDIGVIEVHYKFLYRDDEALTVFDKAGIKVVKHTE